MSPFPLSAIVRMHCPALFTFRNMPIFVYAVLAAFCCYATSSSSCGSATFCYYCIRPSAGRSHRLDAKPGLIKSPCQVRQRQAMPRLKLLRTNCYWIQQAKLEEEVEMQPILKIKFYSNLLQHQFMATFYSNFLWQLFVETIYRNYFYFFLFIASCYSMYN